MSYTHRDILYEDFDSFMDKNFIHDKEINVLEIGACGYSLLNWNQDKHYNLKFTGIDNYSEYYTPGIIKMDAHKLDFPDNSFDLVFMSHTAEHFENPMQCFREIKRVLKPEGIVWSCTPWPCEHQILNGDEQHISVLSPMQWMRILRNVGFTEKLAYPKFVWNGQQIPKEQDYMVIVIGAK